MRTHKELYNTLLNATAFAGNKQWDIFFEIIKSENYTPSKDVKEDIDITHRVLKNAAIHASTEIIERLFKLGFDPKVKSKDGHCPSYVLEGIYNNNEDVVWVFIKHGADVNQVDSLGCTALQYAVTHIHHKNTVKKLLDFGANPNVRDLSSGVYPIHNASRYHFPDVFVKLVQHGASLDVTDNDGITPLMYFASQLPTFDKESSMKIADEIIKRGCDVNQKSKSEKTALHFAASMGFIDCVKFLLKHDALIDLQDSSGNTALINATLECHMDIVKLLLQHGANPDILNGEQKTALMVAICTFKSWHHSPYAMLLDLIKGNADVNVNAKNCLWPDPDPHLPLEVAVKINLPDVARLLIEGGCDLNVASNWLDSATPKRFIPKLLINDVELFTVLKQYYHTPRSLADITRLKIRQFLGYKTKSKISQLPLPHPLLEFLNFDELDELTDMLLEKYHNTAKKHC
ncbi:unnamed protein product [Owenia fusiformis]|uniref:Uncharacterized protein n=1 Tax=Owenia fusiformis TaxID=6347 RepID=A0A8J1TD95_OWEFU|nr:unnamed protein product [Owenia fusiformis]